jgi:hypothetical protein
MMAATSPPHMPVTMTVATAHQNGIDAGLRSDGGQRRHRHRRGRLHGHYRQCAESCGSDQQKTIHFDISPLGRGSAVQGNVAEPRKFRRT